MDFSYIARIFPALMQGAGTTLLLFALVFPFSLPLGFLITLCANCRFRPVKWMNIDIAYGYVNSADPERTGSYPYTNSVLGIVNEKLAAAGIPESQLTNPVTDFSGNYTARAHTFSIGVGFSF